jgi:hypothetical protein
MMGPVALGGETNGPSRPRPIIRIVARTVD